jgi:VanZ like protein
LVVIDSIGWLRSYEVVRTVSRLVAPLALMGVIFALSAQPDLNSGLGGADFVLRKLAHMAAFGLLWWLWLRALGRPLPAVLVTLAYAASDEWHQSFVEGRTGTPVDWAIDATGVAIAIAAWAYYSQPRSVA